MPSGSPRCFKGKTQRKSENCYACGDAGGSVIGHPINEIYGMRCRSLRPGSRGRFAVALAAAIPGREA
jgi:hypothetical protein